MTTTEGEENGSATGPAPTTAGEWMTVPEYARAMRVSLATAYRAVARGTVGPVRRVGRIVRIHRSAVRPETSV